MSVPVFIDINEQNQVAELRSYLKSKGAEISEENSPDGLVPNMAKVIEACEICWKDPASGTDTELESVFNSLNSLLYMMPYEKGEPLITSLCEKLSKSTPADKRNPSRLRLLSNLFYGLEERSPSRYIVYLALVKLAGSTDIMHLLNPDLAEIKVWVVQWDISIQKVQNLLRCLHEAFQETKQGDKATKVMIELLGTYTEDNASQARDDAHRCIVTSLADPNTFLMDHLLTLKPVKFLEGELIHDLLTIFVSGKLTQYMLFYEANKDFVHSIGLSHDQNMQKMRILTFMQMAETSSEIPFKTIQQEMALDNDDIEAFIIDMVRTKAVRCKMDQMSKKVIISSTTHRTFGKQQWQILRESLDRWQHDLSAVLGSLQSLTPR